jgi:hypothetical protein
MHMIFHYLHSIYPQLILMQQLYRKKPLLGKRFCLAYRRAAFLPPASWRVSSGVFYDYNEVRPHSSLKGRAPRSML